MPNTRWLIAARDEHDWFPTPTTRHDNIVDPVQPLFNYYGWFGPYDVDTAVKMLWRVAVWEVNYTITRANSGLGITEITTGVVDVPAFSNMVDGVNASIPLADERWLNDTDLFQRACSFSDSTQGIQGTWLNDQALLQSGPPAPQRVDGHFHYNSGEVGGDDGYYMQARFFLSAFAPIPAVDSARFAGVTSATSAVLNLNGVAGSLYMPASDAALGWTVSGSIDVTPKTYWPYASLLLGPTYDTTTGATLINPFNNQEI